MPAYAEHRKQHEFELLSYFYIMIVPSDMKPDVPYNKWDDPDFVAEMEARVKSMEDGADKGHTWEEVKENARLAIKKSGNAVL